MTGKLKVADIFTLLTTHGIMSIAAVRSKEERDSIIDRFKNKAKELKEVLVKTLELDSVPESEASSDEYADLMKRVRNLIDGELEAEFAAKPSTSSEESKKALPNLPRPHCTFANQSYPAFTTSQMRTYAIEVRDAALSAQRAELSAVKARLDMIEGNIKSQRKSCEAWIKGIDEGGHSYDTTAERGRFEARLHTLNGLLKPPAMESIDEARVKELEAKLKGEGLLRDRIRFVEIERDDALEKLKKLGSE